MFLRSDQEEVAPSTQIDPLANHLDNTDMFCDMINANLDKDEEGNDEEIISQDILSNNQELYWKNQEEKYLQDIFTVRARYFELQID